MFIEKLSTVSSFSIISFYYLFCNPKYSTAVLCESLVDYKTDLS